MSEIKTKATPQSPKEFLSTIEPMQKQKDCLALLELYEQITKEKAVMWGTSIIGFGMYHYKSEKSKQEGDWPLSAFSPRKQNLTLYGMGGFEEDSPILKKLGKHKKSGGCLHIHKLSDIDISVLSTLIETSHQQMKKKFA